MTDLFLTRRQALGAFAGLSAITGGALVGCSGEDTSAETAVSTEQGEQTQESQQSSASAALDDLAWWKKTIVLEVYPKSYLDTVGEGTGTIAGITEKLDYIASLGVGAIWLTPVYVSPQKDNGYDVADYYEIDPRFGTMEDMDTLIAEAGARGIRIVMDLVMNHTSDENPWFTESRSSADNPKADWYIWRDGLEDGSAPTNWRGIFGGPAWTFDETRGQYYLHTFADFQPDLNWECAEMRAELYKMARFWMEKGLGGFRIDAVVYIKKPAFEDGEVDGADGLSSIHRATANTPGILDFLREFKGEVMEGTDGFTVGEAAGVPDDDLYEWIGDEGVFDMIFGFNHIPENMGTKESPYDEAEWTLTDLKQQISGRQSATDACGGWYPMFFENHDQPRSVDQFMPHAQDKNAAAKTLGCILMTMRGTPFLYQAEELGFRNVAWASIDDYDDVSTLGEYEEALLAGKTEEEALEYVHNHGRENARTPMQWDVTENAGFTTGTPWLPVHDDYEIQNVDVEGADEDSPLTYYRALARLREELPVLAAGDWEELLVDSEEIYAYERRCGEDRAIMLANYTEGTVDYDASLVDGCTCVLSTHGETTVGTLEPLEAVIFVG